MLERLDHWSADARASWTHEGVGFGHLLLQTTATADAGLVREPDDDLAITGDLRLDNRSELAARLGIEARDLDGWSNARLVLRAYREWGHDSPVHLLGDFAFAIWDGRRRRLFAARDPFGVKPLYYARRAGAIAFATEMKGLLALQFVDRSIDETWLGDFLHRLNMDRVNTLYTGIKRLEPAHAMTVDADGFRQWRYWAPDTHRALRLTRDEDYIEAFSDQLVLAVRRRIETPFEVGAELSGGLDSSALCAIASRLLRRTDRGLHVFAQVRPEGTAQDAHAPEDARDAVEAVCQHAGIANPCLLTGEGAGILPMIEWAARHCDEPPQNVISLFNDGLYDAAASRGVRVLLSGFGGNQCVSADAWGWHRELLLAGRWTHLWSALSVKRDERHPALALMRLLAGYLAPWARPTIDAALRRGPTWLKHPYRASRDDFARRVGMWRRTLRSTFVSARRFTLNEEVAHYLSLPVVASRLENAHLSATARRIEYRYPLLDRELIATYMAMPSHLKHIPGQGRSVFRSSLAGWVPDEVRQNTRLRASANPGNPARKRLDRERLMARLHRLPGNAPLFRYVDVKKLSTSTTLEHARGRRWSRDTELIGVLILAEKLSQGSGSVSEPGH